MTPMRVSVVMSEPWDLGESLRWQPLHGHLLRVDDAGSSGRALIQLGRAVDCRGASYEYLVAAPRHKGDRVGDVERGNRVLCSFVGISKQQALSENSTNVSDWRGGLALIGELIPVGQEGG